jgi:hypothetical protein
VELIVTTVIGPRVIRFGFVGEANEFYEHAKDLGKRGGRTWRLGGGHRLWHAPEDAARTYAPDNDPVQVEPHSGFVRFIQPTEPSTGIQKELDIRVAGSAARVRITHRLRNHNRWMVELAPWTVSMMAPGGTGIIPLPPRGSHPKDLSPTSTLTLWAFTDLSDPRWMFARKYVLLRQDTGAGEPQKIGARVLDGWAAYARGGHLFVKRFPYCPAASYADLGANCELFTNKDTLEVESLGPLTRLEPGATLEHVEHWFLFRNVPVAATEADVDRFILPRVRTTRAG